eukprot:scaffold739_cov38-Prasinocladus_malaysianus.AAC.2
MRWRTSDKHSVNFDLALNGIYLPAMPLCARHSSLKRLSVLAIHVCVYCKFVQELLYTIDIVAL